VSLKQRVERAEQLAHVDKGRCPDCPPDVIALVIVDDAGNILEGEYPKRCQSCGGPYTDRISFEEWVFPRTEAERERDAAAT
jgi:hypothetical protein